MMKMPVLQPKVNQPTPLPKFGCSNDGMMHFAGKAQNPSPQLKFGCYSDGMVHFSGKSGLNVKA